MSFIASCLLGFMKVARLKKRLAGRSLEQLHAMSVAHPPDSIRKNNTVESVDIQGCRAHWINKERREQGVLVYLHGGGYTFGPIDFQWEYIALMSQLTSMAALVVDYRQLPLHPFPTGLNDAVGVITALQQASDIPKKWILIGDSAGGGLALATTYKLREIGAPQPEKLILLSPWLDITTGNPQSLAAEARDPIIAIALVDKIAEAYASPADRTNPLVSTLYGDVSGLPPVLLQVGTREILLWGCRTLHQKCLLAGVDIRYEEYSGMFHSFQVMNFLPEGKKARRVQVDFILSSLQN